MEKASKVMYTIANIFNWIIAISSAVLMVLSILAIAGVLPEELKSTGAGAFMLVYSIVSLLAAIVAIILVRIAKNSKSSKGWDILFIVVGVIEGNIFYILGGIFGLVARR